MSESPGLIPAHAGKTLVRSSRSVMLTAHPRSRGENWVAGSYPATWRGSSPLTRGKQTLVDPRATRCRLIPAHAGKTRSSSMTCWPAAAHPRSRGENVDGWEDHVPAEGSSPLTRGKHWVEYPHLLGVRLIPAHAGKT